MNWNGPDIPGDGRKIDDRHRVILLDPEDGELAVTRDGTILVSGILPDEDGADPMKAARRALAAATTDS